MPSRISRHRSTSRPTSTRRDEARAALGAIGRLSGDRRRALILRFVDEMSTAEIAGVLGRSEGAVRVLIHRALRNVARDLAEREPVMPPEAARDATEIDALVTDRYLETLLAAHASGADLAPAPLELDPGSARSPNTWRVACRGSIRRSASRRRCPPG